MRMLMNNLDPNVAENPSELIVYGGGGKAARNWDCYYKIVETLKRLENDETLLVQKGKLVGVFRTHEEAPCVLIANANIVPRWATADEFRRLDALGLTMYGQMTAGLGGMGGAQPLAATMNGAAVLAVEIDEGRIRRRVETGYFEDQIGSLEVGKSADFAVIDAPDVDDWMYHFKPNSCLKTVVRGTSLKGSD